MVDTHCHLYVEDFKGQEEAVIQRALNAGVKQFLLPAIDSESHNAMLRFEELFIGKCFSMMGLHPCSVKENVASELALVEEWLQKRKFYGIGEIGIDLYWDKTFYHQQIVAFKQQINWAHQFNLPVSIHSRNATRECIDILKSFPAGYINGVFHCFSGQLDEAKEIIDLGLYLGIGGVVTFKNSGLDKILKEIEVKHLVLETDSPYLSPVPYRGKVNESSYLVYVADKLGAIYSMSREEIASVTTKNAKKIFSIE